MARILVIEDDVSFGDILRVHLTALGHEIKLTREPAEGIRSILEMKPDLILTDLNMPYLGGLELLEAVRGEESTRSIPIIVLTGRVDDDSHLKAMQLGVSHYLTKPVALADLIKAVRSALARNMINKP